MLDWLTPWRLRVYPRAVLAAIVVGWAFVVARSTGGLTPQGALLGGDWVTFHAAGSMVLHGTPEGLLDAEAFKRAQEVALGRESLPGYHPWLYPPYDAPLFAPFAALPYLPSYLVWTVLTALAVVVAGRALATVHPKLDAGTFAAGALCFHPLMRAVTGGQNTACSLVLASLALAALHQRRDVAAGVALGLMAFKPHFAIPLLFFVAVAGRWRALVAAAGVGVGWFALGVATLGWDWLPLWLHGLSAYRELAGDVTGPQLVSLVGVCEQLLGFGSPLALAVGGTLTLALVGALVALFVTRPEHLPACYGAAVGCLPLISPHTQGYDLGLLVLPAAGLAAAGRRPIALLVLCAAPWVLAPFQEGLPFQPQVLVALAGGALALEHAWRAPTEV